VAFSSWIFIGVVFVFWVCFLGWMIMMLSWFGCMFLGVWMCRVLSVSWGMRGIFVVSMLSMGYFSNSSCLVNSVSPPNFSAN